MLKKILVAQGLIDHLASHLEQAGFVANRSAETIEKKAKSVKFVIRFLFYTKSNGIVVNPFLWIRFKEIEDTYFKVRPRRENPLELTGTLGNSLGNIIRYMDTGKEGGYQEYLQYLVENENDLEILKQVLLNKIIQYALPYFEFNSSLDRVDRLLNENPRELTVHCSIYPIRACIGLIAAKLVGNPTIDDLASFYSYELTDAEEQSRGDFENLKRLLLRQ